MICWDLFIEISAQGTPILKDLHWLPVEACIESKTLTGLQVCKSNIHGVSVCSISVLLLSQKWNEVSKRHSQTECTFF